MKMDHCTEMDVIKCAVQMLIYNLYSCLVRLIKYKDSIMLVCIVNPLQSVRLISNKFMQYSIRIMN